MLQLFLPVAYRWREVGEKLDHLDEIFTNNERDIDCLHNLVDVFGNKKSRRSIALALQEIGETDLAVKCYSIDQGDFEGMLCVYSL